MPRYSFTLAAKTPVSAGRSDERANVREAHLIIPGATLRGALGASWWQEPAHTDQVQFEQLFDRDLLVGQAVPVGMELISASARVCKYRPLTDCRTVLQDRGLPGRQVFWEVCWECGGPLVQAAGWRRTPQPSQIGGATLVARTRGALTEREQATDNQLFTRQAVVGSGNGPAVFTGSLHAPAQWSGWLSNARVRIGGGRSLDYGRAETALQEEPWPTLPGTGPFLLRLVSPAILLDAFGGPDVSLEALTDEVRRVSGDHVSLDAEPSWLRTESVGGWHMRSRLPKVLDWALAPGSAAVVDGLSEAGWQRLAAGLGVRTLEGYGQLELVSPGSIPEEPVSEGPAKVKVLRAKVPQAKQWQRLQADLIRILTTMLPAEADALDTLRESTFPGLTGEQALYAKAVLKVPPAHIPGTIDALKGRKQK